MARGNIWEQILARVSGKVNTYTFYKWFRPTSFVADAGETITVRVPEPQFKDWLSRHYSGIISDALSEVGRGRSVRQLRHRTRGTTPESLSRETQERSDAELDPVAASQPHGLNPRYTFDTFIVGPSNQFAHAACRAVAEAPAAGTTRCTSTAAWGSGRRI